MPVSSPAEDKVEDKPEEEYLDQQEVGEYDENMYNMYNYGYNNEYPHPQRRTRGGGAYRPASRQPVKAAGGMGMPMQPNMHMNMMYNQQPYYGGVKPEAYGEDRKQRPMGQPMSGKHSPVSAPQHPYQQGPADMMLPGGAKKPGYQANPNAYNKNAYNKNYPGQPPSNPKAKNPMGGQHYYNNMPMHGGYQMPYMYGGYPQYPYYPGQGRANYPYYPDPHYYGQGEEDYQGQDNQGQQGQGQQDYDWEKEKKDRRAQQQATSDFGVNSYSGYNQFMVPQQQQQQQNPQQQQNQYRGY
jgi:hypothetical protein